MGLRIQDQFATYRAALGPGMCWDARCTTIFGNWRVPSGEIRLSSISMAFRIAYFLGKLGDDPACLNAMRIGGRLLTGLYPEAVDNGPTLT